MTNFVRDYVLNSKSVVQFVLVDFGEGSCSCCDSGKTKSTLCPTDLLSLNWSLTKYLDNSVMFNIHKKFLLHFATFVSILGIL